MAENNLKKRHHLLEHKVLFAAARRFMTQGYTSTTIKEIAKAADLSVGSVTNLFGSKEGILCGLVAFASEKQHLAAEKLLQGLTDDVTLFYAAETVLQLNIAESDENLRELYCSAYSLPRTSGTLIKKATSKIEKLLSPYTPGRGQTDYYKLAIASCGIMRGFMTVPCDMWFTMEQKTDAFLESSFLVFRLPQEKIDGAKEFIRTIDFKSAAKETVQSMIDFLESNQQQ